MTGQQTCQEYSMASKPEFVLRTLRPWTLWIYCFGHNMKLVVQDSMQSVQEV